MSSGGLPWPRTLTFGGQQRSTAKCCRRRTTTRIHGPIRSRIAGAGAAAGPWGATADDKCDGPRQRQAIATHPYCPSGDS